MGKGKRTPRLVIEDTAEMVAVWENVGLMWEVCAAGVDEVDAWETLDRENCVSTSPVSKRVLGGMNLETRLTIFLRNGLSAKMFLHCNGIVCSAFDSVVPFFSELGGRKGETTEAYVLSLATIIHCTPCIVPTPVMIPPAGTSSPG